MSRSASSRSTCHNSIPFPRTTNGGDPASPNGPTWPVLAVCSPATTSRAYPVSSASTTSDFRSTREAQAALAAQFGVSAFCYWHYWFGGGRRILERPFDEVVKSGQPDFPFCLSWANATWSGIWYGAPERVLIEQTYPGEDDHRSHFEALLPAFMDPRYFRVDGRPLFCVFDPAGLPAAQRFLDLWRDWAVDAGLPGIYFVGQTWGARRSSSADFDAFAFERVPSHTIGRSDLPRRLARRLGIAPLRSFRRFAEGMPLGIVDGPSFPIVMPGWDNTPRSGVRGVVLHPPDPAIFEAQVAHRGRTCDVLDARRTPPRLGQVVERMGRGLLSGTRPALRAVTA